MPVPKDRKRPKSVIVIGAAVTSDQTAGGTKTPEWNSRSRSSCPTAPRQINTEASLMTTGIGGVVGEVLLSVMPYFEPVARAKICQGALASR